MASAYAFDRRRGRFSIDASLAREFNTGAKRVMGLCIIVRAELMFNTDRIEYHALSERFRQLAENEVIPEYVWYFTHDGNIWCEER